MLVVIEEVVRRVQIYGRSNKRNNPLPSDFIETLTRKSEPMFIFMNRMR